MTDLHSIEKLRREELSDNEKQKIIKLDYSSYFAESVENLFKCETLEKELLKVNEDYETTAKLLKTKFAESREADDQNELKISFGANIKLWFTKVWTFIVSVFQNITYSIINMIKALILYIQKKRVTSNSIYKAINEQYFSSSAGFHTHADDRFGKLAADPKYYSVKTKSVDGSERGLTFSDIHARFNDGGLYWFVYDNKIILENKKSLFNLKTLKEYAVSELSKENSEDSLSALEQNVAICTTQAIIGGEISNNFNSNINKYFGIISSGSKPQVVADLITYGTTNTHTVEIPTIEFLGLNGNSSASVTKLLRMYLDDSKRIIGQGGYIDVLTEILKKYKDVAARDAATIKDISNYVTAQVTAMADNSEIISKYKRFTNMVLQIKSVKTKFVALRQGIIGNLLTMYSAMDYGINQLLSVSDTMEAVNNNKGTGTNKMIVVTDTGTMTKKRNDKAKKITGKDGDIIADVLHPADDLYEEGDESLKQ